MSKLLLGKIDVKKIVKSLLFEGKEGTYLDVVVWINDEEDKYGNIASIQQATKKDDPKIYIGNLKEYKPKEEKITPAQNTGLPNDESYQDDDIPF